MPSMLVSAATATPDGSHVENVNEAGYSSVPSSAVQARRTGQDSTVKRTSSVDCSRRTSDTKKERGSSPRVSLLKSWFATKK